MTRTNNSDWMAFKNETTGNKADILYNYICLGSGNMEEIGRRLFGRYDQYVSHRISVVTRWYGFHGRNSGCFRHIGATREDVLAFVRTYPNGCEYDDRGQTMEAFLRNRVQKRLSRQSRQNEEHGWEKQQINAVNETSDDMDLLDKIFMGAVWCMFAVAIIAVVWMNTNMFKMRWYINIGLVFAIYYIGARFLVKLRNMLRENMV